jgi:hypothetical protein
MELFAGFNAEELAMMQELLRLLVEDDDVLPQQPTPRRQDSHVPFDGPSGTPKFSDGIDYQWGMGVQNGMAWTAPPAMVAPASQYATKAARTRTRSNFASDDEPMLKRGRMDVAPTMMRAQVSCTPFPEGSRVGYSYF